MRRFVSIVIPVYNERETLLALASRVSAVVDRHSEFSFEVLLVDDGSRDGSGEIVDALCDRDPRFNAIHLSRNFGHQAALQAGLDAAGGDAVVLMDADLQDPPELIEQFLAHWKGGADVVYAIRRNRRESYWKTFAYRTFYRSLRAIAADVEIVADAGDFCLMDRRVVDALGQLRERNRFLRGLRSWVGFEQVGVEYDRGLRAAGTPKYTLGKLMGLALSGWVGFSMMPLRVASWLGVLSASVGGVVGVWMLWTKIAGIESPRGWASTMAMILFVGGVQLIMLGVIGEYLGRVYEEVRARPVYVVRARTGRLAREDAQSESPGGRPRLRSG